MKHFPSNFINYSVVSLCKKCTLFYCIFSVTSKIVKHANNNMPFEVKVLYWKIHKYTIKKS